MIYGTNAFDHARDGADHQSAAVLAFLGSGSNIEESWSTERRAYDAIPSVARWHNFREQGYVISMSSEWHGGGSHNVHIAFFEHRNTDQLHAVVFQRNLMNPPTINDIPETHQYTNGKYNTDFSVDYGEIREMADFIKEVLTDFWIAHGVGFDTAPPKSPPPMKDITPEIDKLAKP